MNRTDYWSVETNPESGAKFEQFKTYMVLASNGELDLARLIDSEYGEAFAKKLDIRFRYEDDAMGEAALAYYRSIGLKKEMFDAEDYYTRWVLFTPLEADLPENVEKKYPLVISQHGGGSSIETEEFSCGYPEIAAREGFMLMLLQNTNWDNVREKLQKVLQERPVNPERVYMSGLSQGGSQTNTALFRMPELLTAIGPNSCDFFRTSDNFDEEFTPEEYAKVKKLCVPFIYTVGACDASYYVPLNHWQPRKAWKTHGDPETFKHPDADNEKDPVWIHDPAKGFRDAARLAMKEEPHWWMPHPSHPGPDEDVFAWSIDRVNKRLASLGCQERDPATCISFYDQPEDAFHHLLGFYGDREEIKEYYGCRHYFADCFDDAGVNVFRVVVVENWPHWQSVMMGELNWEFFKQFRRDKQTGTLIADPYCK